MNPQLELRHLRYFLAVAEELHFGRAAARLGVAQPALSQQIRRLEQMVGAELFRRSTRRVQLTDAGMVLLGEARRIVADVQGAGEVVRRVARGETGTLTVAFAASVMFLALPRIIRRFRAQYPDVRLELRELPTAQQLAGLYSGELDIGFVRQPSPDEELHLEVVMHEPLLVAIAKSHPLATRTRFPLRELAHEDFVLFPRDVAPGLHAQVLALCRNAGFTPNVVQESRELYTTVSLVEAGVGVTIIPASVRKMGWRGVAYKPILTPLARTRVAIAWNANNTRPVVQSFIEVVRGTMRGVLQ
jgi:DNA-binding transcriptional LysR family regulator